MFRRLAAMLAVLGLALMVAAPALANDLHQPTPISWDDPAFQGSEEDCADADIGEDEVLWHFVHVGTSSADLPSTLTAEFETAGVVTVSGYVNGDSIVMYDIITGQDTLLSASDTIETDPMTEPLNLSHICPGGGEVIIPEAPASVLLVLTAGILGLAFLGFRMRRSVTVA